MVAKLACSFEGADIYKLLKIPGGCRPRYFGHCDIIFRRPQLSIQSKLLPDGKLQALSVNLLIPSSKT